ncbi:MAG TPA: HlyD family efflux transporter periplasmic adaptor subunit [Solirubrobacteraceae bacterium]|nr:HlyD family efflux transporter periplasmic adaptor subunit [Solirubrobacteraceae bacterium]
MSSVRHSAPRWLTVALGACAVALIVLAALLVGAPGQASSGQTRVVKVRTGVVQSTVSGSGNIQPATQLDLGFKTAGVVQRIYVTQGQYVTPGKLLAELNPQSAEVTLEQAKATLQAAEATLVQDEESGGETSSGSSGVKTTAATTASTTMTTVALTTTTPAKTTPATSTSGSKPTSTVKTPSTPTTTTPSTSTSKAPSSSSGSAPSTAGSAASSPEKTTQSAATKEANLASARAAVKSDKLAVQSDEQAVANTKLYAPTNGTVVSLSGEVGENVSGTGTTKASTAASSSSTTSSGSGAAGGASTTGRTSSTASSSTSSSSSTPSFAVLSDLGSMQLVVPLSESEVVQVHVGQPATVTVEALEGQKLSAHVVSVATLSTSNSGVVSYPVTFQLDQAASALKPGMSASAEVVVKQQEGINVPTSAISGKAVTVVRGGKRVRQAVVTGLAGNSSTIILSGLAAGEEIVLPVASTGASTSITSKLGGRGGGALGGGGGFPGGGPAGGGLPGGARGGGG